MKIHADAFGLNMLGLSGQSCTVREQCNCTANYMQWSIMDCAFKSSLILFPAKLVCSAKFVRNCRETKIVVINFPNQTVSSLFWMFLTENHQVNCFIMNNNLMNKLIHTMTTHWKHFYNLYCIYGLLCQQFSKVAIFQEKKTFSLISKNPQGGCAETFNMPFRKVFCSYPAIFSFITFFSLFH